MKRKNIRCMTAIMLTVVLATGMLNGCKTESKEKKTNTAKGRYVEEDIELPIKEGETIVSLSESKGGIPVLFAQTEKNQVERYEYVEGKWKKTVLEWLNATYKDKDIYWMDIVESQDGTQLITGMDEEQKTYLARSIDGKTGEELDIPYLNKKTEYGYPCVAGIEIDGEGNYWIQDMYQSKLIIVSPDTLDTLEEVESADIWSSDQKVIFAGKDGKIAVNTKEGVYTVFDKERTEQGTFSVNQLSGLRLCSDTKNWYMISEEGITRMKPGNDTKEIIMDGSMGAMGSPVNSIKGFIVGENTDFYALYSQPKTQTYSLAHYVYDKEIEAVPEHTLQVFGISESDTVRQAIIGFQKKNPDIKVEFNTSGKEPKEVSSDDIRTLNTELLSGKGADILLLDGLAADAYIEKGVLLDLTDIEKKLMKGNSYLENMLKNTAAKDEKIYGLPVKFAAPIMYGDENAKKALESLESLKSYLEENSEAPIFGITSKEYIRDLLFQLYQDEILEKGKTVNQKKLSLMFELAGKIAESAKTEIFEEEEMNSVLFCNPGNVYLIKHPDGVNTENISNLSGMMIPYQIMRDQKLAPETVKNYYIPQVIAGINKNTKQQENAKEFIKYLFSEEVQGAQLDDGFPVLQSALDEKVKETESDYASSYSMMSGTNLGGEEISVESRYPTKEEVQKFVEMCKGLKNPVKQDRAVWNIYQSEADRYLDGIIDAKEAAKNIAGKVDLYLAE